MKFTYLEVFGRTFICAHGRMKSVKEAGYAQGVSIGNFFMPVCYQHNCF